VKDHVLHITPRQIDELILSLHRFHDQYGALGALIDEKQEEALLGGFRHLLEHFLKEGAEIIQATRDLADAHFRQSTPFALLIGSFNHLKQRLIWLVASNMPDPLEHYQEIDRLFEAAKRETARQYLLLETASVQKLPENVMQGKTLIRIYLDWLEQVRRAIREDLAGFPLEPADRSEFARALRYPESLLICLDLKLCDQLMEQHRLIHQQASLLYAMLAAGRHEQAYIAYQEVVKKVAELLNLLSMLYLEGQTNRVRRFFDFLQAALYLPGRKFFCVINLAQLGKINRLYGNEVGDRALARVEEVLQQEFEAHPSWMYFTRGIAGDFYLIGFDTEPGPLESLLERVRKKVNCEEPQGLPVEIGLVHHGIELTYLSDLTTENLHLLVRYLTEEARESRYHVEVGEERTERMFRWLREQYRKSVDLRGKLTEEFTDIFIQPLVTLDERRRIHAFEVLGRFREKGEYISAGLFIDDIITMGLVTDFDRLVLKAVVRQADALSRITRRLFINASSASLEQSAYVEELVAALKGPLQGFEVIIELTEQMLLQRRMLVEELHRKHDIHFAIDDFGTGYSTLQTVIELALDGSIRYLKLDGSLTRTLSVNPASERIMQITQKMARELELQTVVEFIETAEQADRLEALQMDFGQGYLLGVPDPVPVWLGKLNYLESKFTVGEPVGFTL